MASVLDLVLPKRRPRKSGRTATGTFRPTQTEQRLSVPAYRDHLEDIFSTRTAQDSRSLLKSLFNHDPDVSAAVNAYLTIANTDPVYTVRDENGQIDREGHQLLDQIITALTYQTDYSKRFQLKPSLRTIAENMRYMVLLRGGCASELIVNEQFVPTEVRNVDLASIEWYERKAGQYKPVQKVDGQTDRTDLDVATFFVSFFHRDPTEIYPYSNFVSAINTIAARQTMINEMYRIMQVTGFPRIDISVVEDVVTRNAPADVRADAKKLREYVNTQMRDVANQFADIRSDQAFVHSDSIETKVVNERNPGVGIPIEGVIEVLNSQNQAALKTMATIIGRGESGVNTASVEARVFSLNADELNAPVAESLSRIFTMALHLMGRKAFVEFKFRKVELRPDTELEPQMVTRQTRLHQDLSLGLITDEEYHLEMYGRIAPDGSPQLQGTGFMSNGEGADVRTDQISPNSDPVGRSVASPEGQAAKSNQNRRQRRA